MSVVFIVLPAYNEEKSISSLLDEIGRNLKYCNQKVSVIVVNDGSNDKTGEIVDTYKNSINNINIIQVRHKQNLGLGNAIKTGFKTVLDISKDDNDMVIYMDADNTHPPEYCLDMINKLTSGYDIVIASRYQKGSKQVGVPIFRRVLSFAAVILFSFTLKIPGIKDYTCGFRAYRAGLLRKALNIFGDEIITRNGFACTDELLVKLSTLTNQIIEIPFILRYDRKKGKSKIRLFVTVIETIKMLINYKKIVKK